MSGRAAQRRSPFERRFSFGRSTKSPGRFSATTKLGRCRLLSGCSIKSVKVLALYKPRAVHVTAARTVQGEEALRAWYQSLFKQLLPEAVFRLTGYTGSGSSRHLTWTAASEQGEVHNGKDTLGLSDDKIMYHYSFFSVT